MAGNSFGEVFRVTTFGESHGPAVGVVVDGVPSGLALTEETVQRQMDRRRPGQSSISTSRSESDKVEILSGVFEGLTTGHPVTMMVRNRDVDSSDYEGFKHLFRPGHADYTYHRKYGIRDWRGSGRASGRETAARVAGGAVAGVILQQASITVAAFARRIGDVEAVETDLGVVEGNVVRTCDAGVVDAMVRRIEEARERHDSIGGIVELRISGCPPGLGEPVFDKLDARLAHAIMSIGAIKGVEIGAGFGAAGMLGSGFNDVYTADESRDAARVRTLTNNAGGILGGISTGEDIVLRAAVRPPASIGTEQRTVDLDGEESTITVGGRHDPCIVPRVIPVVEAMAAITVADALLLQRGHGHLSSGAPGRQP